MQEIQIIEKAGQYSCETGMTVGMWKEVLQDTSISTFERLDTLIKFYNEPNHKSTCKLLAQKYDNGDSSAPQRYNSHNTHFGKDVCDKFNLSFKRADGTGDSYWIVAMTGKLLDNKLFEWALRPELVQAMEELLVQCPNLGLLIDQINSSLGEKFINDFRYFRKDMAKLGRAPSMGKLFKYDDDSRDWAINEGGHIEEQYHIYLRDGEIGYGIGFNTQFTPFYKVSSFVDCMQPYADAYLRIKDSFPVTVLKESGFCWVCGNEDDLAHLESNNYYLLAKTIAIENDTIKWTDFQTMLSYIRGVLYNLYKAIFENKNAQTEKKIKIMKTIEPLLKLLAKKKNIILQGAPGTGKTYTTASLAVGMCNNSFVNYSNHKQVMQEYERLRVSGQIAFCTFHQSMDYEDFVEGLQPVPLMDDSNNSVGVEYKVIDGIFKNICNDAMDNLVSHISDSGHRDYDGIFEAYCKYIESELAKLKDEGKDPAITFHPKSKMMIRGVNRKGTGNAISLIISQSPSSSTQNLSKSIFIRDYSNYLEGKIKDYTQVAPAYSSKSSCHGNAMYYFALYSKIKEFAISNGNLIKTPVMEDKKNYVLVIDEINRGNVSRIFGELITLLDSDKRYGEKSLHPITVTLPYSRDFDTDDNGGFAVPDNLFIIGTMNTTDRSTGTIDYAVRRRFAFVTLESSYDTVSNWYDENKVDVETKKAALSLFDEINGKSKDDSKSFVAKHKIADFELEDLKVGHSYFMADDIDSLKLKMKYEVIPLIKEYIKDGILRGHSDDEHYFNKWMEATCLSGVSTSDSIVAE